MFERNKTTRIIQTPTLEHRYDHVTMFGNHEISLALFVLIFLAGGLDCTTSVVFFPVARRLSNDKTYITALMLGEAMTGLLTSTLSTLQSLNDYKILSIKTFFVILSVIVIVATMSFRYIETRMMSMKENRSNVPRRRKMDEMKLFLGQAALAFVENGLHTTLLPARTRVVSPLGHEYFDCNETRYVYSERCFYLSF